jgi:hypothetical protein
MSDETINFLSSTLVLGVVFGLMFFTDIIQPTYITSLLYKCQETLPRNQHCKIIAVPDEIK